PTISRRGLISAAKLEVKPGNVPRSIGGLWLLSQYAACISPPKSVVPTIRPDSLIAFATRAPRSITIYLNCGDACGASPADCMLCPDASVTAKSEASANVSLTIFGLFMIFNLSFHIIVLSHPSGIFSAALQKIFAKKESPASLLVRRQPRRWLRRPNLLADILDLRGLCFESSGQRGDLLLLLLDGRAKLLLLSRDRRFQCPHLT